jgi:hypothetical protein
MNMANHLWWNGYDHSFGETAEEASKNYQRMVQCDADEAEGDGWVGLADDTKLKVEETNEESGETAAEYAEQLSRHGFGPAAEQGGKEGERDG